MKMFESSSSPAVRRKIEVSNGVLPVSVATRRYFHPIRSRRWVIWATWCRPCQAYKASTSSSSTLRPISGCRYRRLKSAGPELAEQQNPTMVQAFQQVERDLDWAGAGVGQLGPAGFCRMA